jgi:hypothetical protein
MTPPYAVSSSEFFPVEPAIAFDTLVDAPLEDLFVDRVGPIPPVQRCDGQDGAWGTAGQSRKVVLADGSSNLETLVATDRPHDYRYRLTDFTGPFSWLVAAVDGRFTFVPESAGTRATWSWSIHPRNAAARLLLPVVGIFWRRMAQRMWPRFGVRLAT